MPLPLLQGTFRTVHHMGIVLEYLDGGDLSELVDRRWADGGAGISEAEARRLFQQLMVAVDYCHRMGIANRDIKVRTPSCNGHRKDRCVCSRPSSTHPTARRDHAIAVF